MKQTKGIINRLNKLGERSEKKGYSGDAVEYWFRAKVLELLEKQVFETKNTKKEMKYLLQNLKELNEEEDLK